MKLNIEMQLDKKDVNTKIQRFGRFLSGMVMPNIGAFIAWGLFTAFFIESGWFPNASIAIMIEPMIRYLIPILIAFTGGKMVYGQRGGVVASIAVFGLASGAEMPMLLGAMFLGPISGYLLKKADQLLMKHVRPGFKMLVGNFTAGIIGGGLAIFSLKVVGSFMTSLGEYVSIAIGRMIEHGLTPLAALLIEPSKVLFLNNAVNHGILSPLGLTQTLENGKSILFLLETNPGPGFGILLLFLIYSKGEIRKTTPAAMIIHFFGGIHEIYFPYIYMKPLLIIPLILGGASGIFAFGFFNVGLLGVPSPGSIFSILALAPKGDTLFVFLGILISAAVTFFTGSLFFVKKENGREYKSTRNNKGNQIKSLDYSKIKKIAVSCDAGMGSSALGAGILKTLVKKNQIPVEVINCPIDQIPTDTDLIITHEVLEHRVRETAPWGKLISTNNFLQNEFYEEIVRGIQDANKESIRSRDKNVLLLRQNIRLGLRNESIDEAIKRAGNCLVECGYVEEDYILSMLQREKDLSTYIGNGVMIPHGEFETRENIHASGISILQYPNGMEYEGEVVYLVIGIADRDNTHMKILSNLAEIILNEEIMDQVIRTDDIEFIYKQFTTLS